MIRCRQIITWSRLSKSANYLKAVAYDDYSMIRFTIQFGRDGPGLRIRFDGDAKFSWDRGSGFEVNLKEKGTQKFQLIVTGLK